MNKAHAKVFFDTLYSDVNGYAISSQARKKQAKSDQAYTYGEIAFDAFADILETVHPLEGDVFYDLGSGTGKAVVTAHLLFPFSKAVGIEIFEDLNEAALSIKRRYEREVLPSLDDEKQNHKMDFVTADMLEYDFSDGDIIFCHSTCWYGSIFHKLEAKLALLKPGSRVITVSKQLQSPNFKHLKNQEYHMAWGRATVFFYVKKESPQRVVS